MEQMLQLCRDLFQMILGCTASCRALVQFNSELLSALQHLMLEAVQAQQQQDISEQESQLRDVRLCLESAAQLLSHVACLGPIEAFFASDDLALQYQQHVNAAAALTRKIQRHCQQEKTATMGSIPACSSPVPGDNGPLQLHKQQMHVVQAFRQQTAQVFPRHTASLSGTVLHQLCDIVKEGLLLIHGHTFLFGQDWQVEAVSMLGRAEALKVLLAHKQAHHITLLAAILQLLHKQEVQAYEMPHSQQHNHQQQQLQHGQAWWQSNYPAAVNTGAQRLVSTVLATDKPDRAVGCNFPVTAVGGNLQAKLAATDQQGAQAWHGQHAHVVVAAGLEDAGADDDFYMPVVPMPQSSSVVAAAHHPMSPFERLKSASAGVEHPHDSLERQPSSGCTSLLEYMQTMPATADGAPALRTGPSGDAQSGQLLPVSHAASGIDHTQFDAMQSHNIQHRLQLQWVLSEQLKSIAGPYAVPALAAALRVELTSEPKDLIPTYSSLVSRAQSMPSHLLEQAKLVSAVGADGLYIRPYSINTPSAGNTQPDLQSSVRGAGQVPDTSSMAGNSRNSRSAGGIEWQQWPLLQQQLHGQLSNVRQNSSSNKGSSTASSSRLGSKKQCALDLCHIQLPLGACKCIGAVLYTHPHITRLLLAAAGIDDQGAAELADALRVNSSIVLLDLSHNEVEDIGARALASLLKPRPGCSSLLQSLSLHHNCIGDDGTKALAKGLSSSSSLQHLWLHNNGIGAAGAQALIDAMQHNTSCTCISLLPGNAEVADDLARKLKQMAKQNLRLRDRVKGLFKRAIQRHADMQR